MRRRTEKEALAPATAEVSAMVLREGGGVCESGDVRVEGPVHKMEEVVSAEVLLVGVDCESCLPGVHDVRGESGGGVYVDGKSGAGLAKSAEASVCVLDLRC